MILTKIVKVKMNGKHIKKYRDKGYVCECSDIIDVKIEDLPKDSKVIVDVLCDYCNEQRKLQYFEYNTSISNGGKYSCKSCYQIKIKENNLKKYGVESTNQLQSTKDNVKKTLKEKYGIENVSEISQNKVRKTKLERYGDERYNNREKAKSTTIEKYGVDNYTNTDEYNEKRKKTCLEKYGFEHFSQNPNIHRKQQLSGFKMKKYKNLFYRGTYELDFIKYCESINLEIENGPVIEYYDGNTKRFYYSDFKLVNINLICEIKSTYTFNINLEINLFKQDASLKNGYDFIFIIDKNYNEFIEKIKGIDIQSLL